MSRPRVTAARRPFGRFARPVIASESRVGCAARRCRVLAGGYDASAGASARIELAFAVGAGQHLMVIGALASGAAWGIRRVIWNAELVGQVVSDYCVSANGSVRANQAGERHRDESARCVVPRAFADPIFGVHGTAIGAAAGGAEERAPLLCSGTSCLDDVACSGNDQTCLPNGVCG